jgi:hypothetical protein
MTTQLPRRARRLKNLQVTEISSVDRGAGEDCRVVLHKRHGDDVQDQITKGFSALHESVASILDDDGLVDKSDALAMTMEQAHDYFADNFGEVGKIEHEVEIKKEYDAMPAYDQLMAKAVEICKSNPKLSRHQAFAKAYSDPANRDLANADRAQRRGGVQKDAADRLAEATARVRASNPSVTVNEALARVARKNVELVDIMMRKSRNAVDPVGDDEMPGQDANAVDMGNWSPSGSTPRWALDPSNVGSGYGDADDMMLQLWQAWKQEIPGLTVEDVARMVRWQSPAGISVGKGEGSPRSRTPVGDRIHARAAAMVHQNPGMPHDSAVQSILARDKTLARAYQNEIEQS